MAVYISLLQRVDVLYGSSVMWALNYAISL